MNKMQKNRMKKSFSYPELWFIENTLRKKNL